MLNKAPNFPVHLSLYFLTLVLERNLSFLSQPIDPVRQAPFFLKFFSCTNQEQTLQSCFTKEIKKVYCYAQRFLFFSNPYFFFRIYSSSLFHYIVIILWLAFMTTLWDFLAAGSIALQKQIISSLPRRNHKNGSNSNAVEWRDLHRGIKQKIT